MTHSTRITTPLALVLAATLTGCGGPEEYTPKAGLPAAEIYAQACQSCHGENGGGKFGFLLKIAGPDRSPAQIAQRIAEGGVVMPSFPHIPEPERLALAEYLKAQKP